VVAVVHLLEPSKVTLCHSPADSVIG